MSSVPCVQICLDVPIGFEEFFRGQAKLALSLALRIQKPRTPIQKALDEVFARYPDIGPLQAAVGGRERNWYIEHAGRRLPLKMVFRALAQLNWSHLSLPTPGPRASKPQLTTGQMRTYFGTQGVAMWARDGSHEHAASGGGE